MSGKNIIKEKKFLIISSNFFPENFPINKFVDYLSITSKVTVITAVPNYNKQLKFSRLNFSDYFKYKKNNIKIIRLPVVPRIYDNFFFLILFYSSYFIIFTIFLIIYSLNKRNKFDYVIVYSISPVFTVFFGKIYSSISKVKLFVWVQDIWPEAVTTYLLSKFSFIENKIEKFQDFLWRNTEIVAQSIKMKYFFEKKYLRKKIYLIHNPPRLVKNINIKNIRFKKSKKIILSYYGNIGKAQNLDKILETIRSLKLNYKLNIHGSGSELDKIKKKYMSNKINFLPWKEEDALINNYVTTDFFLLSLNTYKRQKYILPGKFSTYINYAKPIIAFGGGNSAIQFYTNKFKVGLFINNNYSKVKKLKLITEYLDQDKDQYNITIKNCLNCYNKFFSKKSIIEQINKIFNTRNI